MQYVRIRCNFLWMQNMLDLLAVCQRVPPYYSVFVTRLKLISNVLSVYQCTCWIFHTSAYVGAIRRSVTGPLEHIIGLPFLELLAFLSLHCWYMQCNPIHICGPRREKTCLRGCEHHRRRPACASAQSNQHICCSLFQK